LNPPHIGHIGIINKALKENDKVLILLWTPLKKNKKNPLNFNTRKKLLETIFIKNDTLKVIELLDNKSDLLWIKNISKIIYENYKIKESIKSQDNINFYWGDFNNDSAYIVFEEYNNELTKYNINYIENSRSNSFIKYEWKEYDISATNLREALKNKNYKLAKAFCDIKIFDLIKESF
jgi:nicotinic acid mononucleotide adenylyltransferase